MTNYSRAALLLRRDSVINSKFNKKAFDSSKAITGKSEGFIYYLMDGDDVAYIGQTIALESRILQHRKDKSFTSVRFVGVGDSVSLNDAEFSQILAHKPALNITLPEVSYLVGAAYVNKKISSERRGGCEVSTSYDLSIPEISIELNGNIRHYWVNRDLRDYEFVKYEIIDCLNNLVK